MRLTRIDFSDVASIVCPRLHSSPWKGQRYHLRRVGAPCVKIAVLTVGRQMTVIVALCVTDIFAERLWL